MPSDDETEVARTVSFAVQAFLKLTNGNERRAAGLMFGAACSWSLSLDIPAKAMVDTLLTEMKRQHDASLDE